MAPWCFSTHAFQAAIEGAFVVVRLAHGGLLAGAAFSQLVVKMPHRFLNGGRSFDNPICLRQLGGEAGDFGLTFVEEREGDGGSDDCAGGVAAGSDLGSLHSCGDHGLGNAEAVGGLLFVTSNVAKVPLDALTRELKPFLIAHGIILIMLTFIPALSTWAPHAFGFQ